ncbi:leucine-rich repeat-containing protein kinase family protein [Pseudomonas sp. TTU2014-080ASC]|uniref:leucine-rich repeat-containing protein kinase family protein n=1 Tax=Pseudomonas sp. TTU2014-080ASC TaxID=1729724 RepID=UPI000718394F|nr:leucine-rich repeat-containing protein kinase family protein [Pseudomonas sp. TTU2014-080ASC]KRW59759.1 protein kinase [Pseudomonas sp. TTU2014-080ASC]
MHTLEQLRSGELKGITRLDLSANLRELPPEVFELADSLEILNLSNNQLSGLPDDLPRLRKLRVLFCSGNPFTELPPVLGQCPQLEMVGFKSCQITQVSAKALPPRLRWLILTDNRIRQLPDELGRCERLQKLMLAGNQLSELPSSLSNCKNLELLRISANQLHNLPEWLGELPKLAWLAFAGNPFTAALETTPAARHIKRWELEFAELLGQGASGIIHAAQWQPAGKPAQAVAVKQFKGQMTSDGLPHCEMAACLKAGEHPNLIRVIGALQTQPDEAPGLVLERIPDSYTNLAEPPSLASCSRDCYEEHAQFSLERVLNIAHSAASAAAHLHQRGILHGDLYGHNLLVEQNGHTLLGDFGAASFFEPDSATGQILQAIETRALGILLEELLQRCPTAPTALMQLSHACMSETQPRPTLKAVLQALKA